MSSDRSKGKQKNAAGQAPALGKRLAGFVLLLLVAFPVLSIVSYTSNDVPLIHVEANHSPSNLIGLAGAWGTWLGYSCFGVGLWMVPAWMALFGVLLMTGRLQRVWRRVLWAFLFQTGLCAMLQLCALPRFKAPPYELLYTGGVLGKFAMDDTLVHCVGKVGGFLVVLLLMLVALVGGIGWGNIVWSLSSLSAKWRDFRSRRMDESLRIEREQRKLEKKLAAERKQAERAARAREAEARREKARAERQARIEEKKAAELAREEAYEAQKEQIRDDREREKARERAAREALARKLPDGEADDPRGDGPAAAAFDSAGGAEWQSPPYALPTVDLLGSLPEKFAVTGDVESNKDLLVGTFRDFNLKVDVTSVEIGPVITTYEILPAPGIRPETIANMAKSIEMRLKATSIRIEAPIPGKGVCGIEIPNTQAGTVSAREILEGTVWREASRKMRLPMLLGKDSSGHDLVCDLASMPHLLVAGATGSGKSVCMNAILTGFLMCRTPDQLRLMLIDPKEVEFSGYDSIPHLVAPIITDPKKVSLGLVWAIHEMEKRFKMLSLAGVKHIDAFNRRKQASPQPLQGDLFQEAGAEAAPPPATPRQRQLAALPDHLPYIVIVIDELSDLMLQVGREIDDSISRLAAKARAAGIHLILATQRPDVKVVTGTIKANIPGRIAFQVASQVDSRTIIDRMGAESLLGHGDMLFLNPRAGRPVRSQGAFIPDEDAEAVADYIRRQGGPRYLQEVQESLDSEETDDGVQAEGAGGTPPGAGTPPGGGGEKDLYEQALDFIRRSRRASTSSLQRQFHIGYSKAAGILDLMEERGIVGPPRGANPREILVDLDGEIPANDGGEAGEDDSSGAPADSAGGAGGAETDP